MGTAVGGVAVGEVDVDGFEVGESVDGGEDGGGAGCKLCGDKLGDTGDTIC